MSSWKVMCFFVLLIASVVSPRTAEAYVNPPDVVVETLREPLGKLDGLLAQTQLMQNPVPGLISAGHAAIQTQEVIVAYAATDSARFIRPVLYTASYMLLAIGYMLAVILPSIPAILWISGLTFWLMTLCITLVSVPFIAARFRMNGMKIIITLALDAMIRPALMTIAFLVSMSLSTAIIQIMLSLTIPMMISVSSASFVGVLCKIVYWLLFSRLIITITAATFSVTTTLPDHVMNFFQGKAGGIFKKLT